MAAKVPVDEWINQPGHSGVCAEANVVCFRTALQSRRSAGCEERWRRRQIPTAEWTTQEWLHFLKSCAAARKGWYYCEFWIVRRWRSWTRRLSLTQSGNSEIAFQWLMMSIENQYEPAYPRLEEFLMSIGRRKFIKPLYEELAKTPEGRERAIEIYRRAGSTYHPIAVTSIDEALKWKS